MIVKTTETNDKVHLVINISEKNPNSALGLIIRNISSNQRHTGFVLFDSNLQPSCYMMAHFGWHKQYHYEKWDIVKNYAMYWIDFDVIPESTALHIVTELSLIAKKSTEAETQTSTIFQINASYGIANTGSTKLKDGVFTENSDKSVDGFTCATFVNFIFENCGFPILDLSSWEINEEDKLWQKTIMDMLLNSNKLSFTHEFIEFQKSQIGQIPRIRPEQMVGACCVFDMEPVNYQTANDAGDIVLKKLDTLFK